MKQCNTRDCINPASRGLFCNSCSAEIHETFDPKVRAAEKQASRDQDEADLKSGRKTPEDLRKENGLFSGFTAGSFRIIKT